MLLDSNGNFLMSDDTLKALVECVYCIGVALENNPDLLKVVEEVSPDSNLSQKLSFLSGWLEDQKQ